MTFEIRRQRKLVSIGYTFLVSLPPTWIDINQLSKGDRISFAIDDNQKLILSPVKKESKQTQ